MRMAYGPACFTGKLLFSTFASLLFIASTLLPGTARGDEFKIIPSLGLKEQYNDNLFFTQKDRKEDFITILSPGLELSDRTENLDLNLSARLIGLVYAKNSDLNAVDHNERGRLLYSPHPNLKFSADAGFRKDSTPGQTLETTGLVTRATRSYKHNFGGGVEYAWNEKTKANFSYSYEHYDYDYGRDSGLLNSTTEGHSAMAGLVHDLSQYLPNSAGRMNLGYSLYQYRNMTVNYYYGTVGMNRALSEKWNVLLDVGPSYTLSEFEVGGLPFLPAGEKRTEEGTGLFGQATLSYRGEKTTGDVTFNHRLAPGTGTVGVTENTFLTLGMGRRFSYELSGRFSTGFYLNKAEKGKYSIAGIDQVSFNVSPALRYEFTKDVALEASYTYALVKDKLADTLRSRNVFMINFTLQHPFFE